MAVTVNDVVSQMRSVLALSEPDLDTTIGTPVRKILDAVGEVVAEAYVDRYLLNYQYDIDTKAGGDLDDFVANFGFNRLASRRASGSITFQRTAGATGDTLIPMMTQVATDDQQAVVVQTLIPAIMGRNNTSLTVPAQALLGGAAGNVPANSLIRSITPLAGVSSFTNLTAFTGGSNSESDEQLRLRFKRTIFRNLAGTEQMFLSTALEDADVSLANVIGASKRRREQVEIVAGTATSTLADERYIYAASVVFGPNLDLGAIFIENVHYTFSTVDGTITRIGTAFPDGIYDLEFEYVPKSSRNDPTNGITNRIDIYVNGSRPTEAVETAIFRTSRTFNSTANDPLNRLNFERTDGVKPTLGNYFIDLSFGPLLDVSVSNTLTIGATVYIEGVDYWTVNDVTREGGAGASLAGFEFLSAANGQVKPIPANGTPFTATYVYNAVPPEVEERVRAWRLITTDVRVHTAKFVRLDVFLAVILTPGLLEAGVRPGLEAAIRDYINNVGFSGVVQISDILDVAHGVPGVDAVRFLTSSDVSAGNQTEGHYAIQRVNTVGTPYDPTTKSVYATSVAGQIRRAIDVIVGDDEVPVFNALTLVLKAQNSWGAV